MDFHRMAMIAALLLSLPASALADHTTIQARARAAVALAYAAVASERPNVDVHEVREPRRPTRKAVSYKDAHERFVQEGKPMVVMVTASWCPHCPPVKSDLERRLRDGELDNASLVILDYDQATQTAKKVMGPYSHLPHVAVYYREGSKERVQRAVQTRHLHRYVEP